MGGCSSSHDEPRLSTSERLQMMFPCDGVAAVAVGHRQNEIARRVGRRDDERIGGTRNRRHDVSGDHRLERGHDARRTWPAAVVNRIPAVPARTAAAHLRDPRPHPFARRVDSDGMSRREDGVGNHRVDSKRTAPFDGSCKAGGERHTGMEEHLPYRLQR